MDAHQIVRQHFRIAVRSSEKLTARIFDKKYELVDVGSRGVGIRLGSEDLFLTLENELDIELDLHGRLLKLKGKIVHISPDDSEQSPCGIEFLDLDRESEETLLNFLKSGRTEMFSF